MDRLLAWLDALDAQPVRAAGRRAHPQGSARPRAVPVRRRAELSHAPPRHAHALRRRGAAHRARQLARLAARRHALRARRAVDRSASARHGSPARACCIACATAATRCSSSSTIPRRSAPRITWWSSGPGAARRAGSSCSTGRSRASRRVRSPARTSPAAARFRVPAERRRVGPRWITLTGAREHNLKSVDVKIPLGAVTVVTGVSGSGKSTLVHDVLLRALETQAARRALREAVPRRARRATTTRSPAPTRSTTSSAIDQSPIGKSPRSNPVTYVKAFDEIRRIFADAPLSRERRYTRGHVQLQRRRRSLRDVRRRGLSRGRDGVHGRRVRAVRRVRRQAVQARGARRARERQERPRRARADGRRGDPLLPARGKARPGALAAAAGRDSAISGSASRRRRSPAAKRSGSRSRASWRSRSKTSGTQALRDGRADHRAAPRRHSKARAACSTGWSTRATRSC